MPHRRPSRTHSSAARRPAAGRAALAASALLSLVPTATLAGAAAAAPESRVPITGFRAEGSELLPQSTIDRLLADVTGPDIPLHRLRPALERLRQAYRDAGLTNAGILLPRQTLAGGTVRLRVTGGPSSPAPAPDAVGPWEVPAFEVRHFVVQGNTALQPEEIDGLLGPAAGDLVAPASLESALRRLREAYVARGWSNAVVRAPSQRLVDGTVAIVVEQGPLLAASVPAATNRPAAAFEVRRFDVSGNTLLKPELVDDLLRPATGTNVSIATVQKALGELQLAYRERGWATVSVSLPQQQITNATVKVRVVEGTLADVRVTGNRHVSPERVLAALPSVRTNALLNSRVFQRELDIANQNRDRQIYPVLGPGPDPGTSSLTLRVKDRLPVHGRVEVNNVTMANAPEWRVNSSLSHNDLWHRDHQAGLSYSFSPERFSSPGPDPDLLLNRPLIASYGAYYRLPFGEPESVEEAMQRSPGFGFDEATRQFRLPPPGARPDLFLFANAAKLDTGVQYGPSRVVSQAAGSAITAQDTGRNVVAIEAAGARFSRPVVLGDRRRLGLSVGLEVRRLGLDSFNTNNFVFTSTFTNSQGTQVIRSESASPQPARRNDLAYVPLTAGIDFSDAGPRGNSYASLALAYGLFGDGDQYDAIAYTRDGGVNFGKASLNLSHDRNLPAGFVAGIRATGQVATGPLVFNEQFAVGGMNTVRGYFEGDAVGDAGWSVSGELRPPALAAKLPFGEATAPGWLRGLVFTDFGQVFPLDSEGAVNRRELWSAGFGVSASLGNSLDLKVTVGWPLISTANSQRAEPRATISVGGQF